MANSSVLDINLWGLNEGKRIDNSEAKSKLVVGRVYCHDCERRIYYLYDYLDWRGHDKISCRKCYMDMLDNSKVDVDLVDLT